MAEPVAPCNVRTEQSKGQRVLSVEASVPRARDVARRVLRAWDYEEVRFEDEGVTRFFLLAKKKAPRTA